MRLENKIGLIGVIPCAAMGAVALVMLNTEPGFNASGSQPLAALARFTAGLFTSPPTLISAGSDRRALTSILYQAGTLLTHVLFAYAFWLRTHPHRIRPEWRNSALLGLQLLLVLAGQLDLSYFIALEVAFLLPLRAALKWLAAVVLGCLLVRLAYAGYLGAPQYGNAASILANAVIITVMQLMSFGVGAMIAAENRRRFVLAATHAELLATQQLLHDMTVSSERMRMARDLHDTIGHHLTALNLHLDLASHRQSEPNESIAIARQVAQNLMSEVRAVVSAQRQDQLIDLRQSLRALCAGIPAPPVTLTFDDGIAIDSPAIAHALFHAVREAVTNALRHARASRIDIAVRADGGELLATVTDNGVGKPDAARGNGLRGILERIAPLSGKLRESVPPGGGFCLQITLPAQARP
ncbi:MAG: sensor histidine kinase [Betaproteobacteria bacterium]|nr:sensor histidine kinase [Betaproteobacteria bacterium]